MNDHQDDRTAVDGDDPKATRAVRAVDEAYPPKAVYGRLSRHCPNIGYFHHAPR